MSSKNIGKQVEFVVRKTVEDHEYSFVFDGVISNWSDFARVYEIYCPQAALQAHGQPHFPFVRVFPADIKGEILQVREVRPL